MGKTNLSRFGLFQDIQPWALGNVWIGLLKIVRSKVAAFNTKIGRDIIIAASFHLSAT